MPYTTVELVRHHLVSDSPVQDAIYDQPLIFAGDEPIRFYGAAISDEDLRVKSRRSTAPARESITINSTTTLASSNLVPGSVVVASDSSLGRRYVEGLDYVVDLVQGSLTVKDGGILEVGQAATIWYSPYFVYTRGVDFEVEVDWGQIRRLTFGSIAPGERVFLDYRPASLRFDDISLNHAVNLANGMVATEIGSESDFGADPALQAAATYVAMEIVCHSAASRQLSINPENDRSASTWMKLGERFSSRAESLLRAFRQASTPPTQPTKG